MKPCKIPKNKTTRGIFRKGGPSITVKKGGPRGSPYSPHPISTTVTNIKFYVNNLKDAPLGASVSQPNFIKNNHGLRNVSLLLLSASPYSGSPQRDSNLHFTRSTSSPSLAPTLSMSSLTKSIHLLLGLPLFLLPGTAISIILFPT